ncbi:hypothetical protein BGM26_13995 [Bacillus sp. FJAT-29790]|uniref:hypothetical protein n=1 Tax=Bacillus sp. FJAT-29790 TaxID=1895002 RepID=UPI001C22B9DF|nr:hypothetical protein [Bacillus sp. FJAT-29790]MBU8880090.1 hypothetical protein [Bacillus sp. FJAT-29790]
MGILLNITQDECHINFTNKEINFFGYTTYNEEVWEKVKDLNWYVDEKKLKKGEKTYIYTGSRKFGKYKDLHQIIMLIWYGEDKIKEAYNKRFIVEHHDNDAFNCLIENLSFASNDINIAKAHTFDKERPRLIDKVTVNFFKDFKSGKYQITLGFNQPYTLVEGSEKTNLTAMHLLYNDDFRLVYTDASRIVWDLLNRDSIDLTLLSHIEREITPDIYIYAKDGQELPPFTFIDGKPVVVLSNKPESFLRLNRVSPKKSLFDKNK